MIAHTKLPLDVAADQSHAPRLSFHEIFSTVPQKSLLGWNIPSIDQCTRVVPFQFHWSQFVQFCYAPVQNSHVATGSQLMFCTLGTMALECGSPWMLIISTLALGMHLTSVYRSYSLILYLPKLLWLQSKMAHKGWFSPGLTKDQGAVFHGCFGSGIHTT